MAKGKFIAYYRVSTATQGKSGLGLAAQREAVSAYIRITNSEVVGEFEEIETGKGSNALERRPQLRAALACKKQDATLLIAKLDRLARNVHFFTGLIETGINFVAANMPQADKVIIQMHAVISEHERDQISARTKAALAAAKARGKILGVAGSANLKSNIEARQQAA
ncbi:recombinase family protein [Klebsiella oxytoca]|uniref:recombinase family protein n=1 Tax=Klebsiella oxytoca TaxID=571 RepID=UPI0007CCD15D|nr:recombinase family protein [Klebsiella oxytoca]MDM4086224.1 recombinase family protein [Klebsiella oxytoca]MDX7088773.1 recombinase family protein [Klebsiella oxytoca]CAF9475136.1 DNA-invertase hin [Klebsiella oxytoca]CAH5678122.1 DNA-invertase hin [Klebsiella oxytoca]CAH5921067.1 DNA-invertase hin [Klebsiella oxytoca]